MTAAKRYLLMGCGAVGGVIAGATLRAGHDLTLITGNTRITEAINRDGLHVKTPGQAWSLAARAHTRPAAVTGPFDIAFLAMKATQVEEAVAAVLPLLAPDGFVVTLQNGVVEDRVSEIIGRERVVGGIVVWGASMLAPGSYEMTSNGETVIGELDNRLTPRLQLAQTVLAESAPVTISTNIYGELWSKLAINSVITTLGAVTGQRLGDMLRQRAVRRLGLQIISEVLDVARAKGVAVEKAGGTLDLNRLYLPPAARNGGFSLDLLAKHLIMFVVGLRFRRLRSSMLQSMERGRRPEIDFMNGYVVEQGQRLGVATPVNAALTAMIAEIERGERALSPANLQEIR